MARSKSAQSYVFEGLELLHGALTLFVEERLVIWRVEVYVD